ncbi:gamma-glutamylcyclotransferase [Aureitalea sp. L0-47]|uniref:gamma-glutamylcyclotransferase family protein n=1 Tax=Aureitalea sp. L0-47 TaxID=2816962 RepID=UPI0022376A62|nr:gamma-glutamylcyclotransferase family protein [Aureitalea sp. L0-47]MCW5518775.1 gamma-glutamylcyclotransferase [Aureitalea sp. L0-47]
MKLSRLSILVILLFLFFSCGENKSKTLITIDDSKIGMIGYGSLMSKSSMERTLNRPYQDSVYIVHLEDYQRDWNHFRSMDGLPNDLFYIEKNDTIPFKNQLALNITESENTKMNCVLFFISPEELNEFDKREFGYKRIDVTDKIEEYEFSGAKVYAYQAEDDHTYKFQKDDNTFLPDFYVNLVINACDSIGSEFREEFETSTKPYDKNKVISPSDVYVKPKD